MSPGKAAFFGAVLGSLAVAAAIVFGMSKAARELANQFPPPSTVPREPTDPTIEPNRTTPTEDPPS